MWHVNYLDFHMIYIKYLHVAYIAVAQPSDSYAEMHFLQLFSWLEHLLLYIFY